MVCVIAMRLLVAEADAALADFLLSRFQQENFVAQVVSEANQISAVREGQPCDLLVLDTNLAGAGGADTAFRQMQRRWPTAPIILLSAETSVDERVRALNAGADDFLVKPFAVAGLLARVNAVLRRRSRPALDVYVFEDLEINRVSHEVKRGGTPLN